MYYPTTGGHYSVGMPPLMSAPRRAAKQNNVKANAELIKGFILAIIVIAILVISFEIWFLGGRNSQQHQSTDNYLSHSSSTTGNTNTKLQRNRRGLRDSIPTHPASHLHNLILVACHSVFTGLDFKHAEEASSWYLLDYQKVNGTEESFLEHIRLGVIQAAADPDSLLMFSGGKTRKDAGPRAESMGYWLVAEAKNWYGHPEIRDRTYTEENARDSFENLLFSICRFYELTGHYPTSILVVGYEFKRERFIEEHRMAVRWPARRFEYLGTPALTESAEIGEAKTLEHFRTDPYGCSGDLVAKRQTRDPFAAGGNTGERCADMRGLIRYCGPGLYSGALPWDRDFSGGVGGDGEVGGSLV